MDGMDGMDGMDRMDGGKMERIVCLKIETDESGEHCGDECPHMRFDSGMWCRCFAGWIVEKKRLIACREAEADPATQQVVDEAARKIAVVYADVGKVWKVIEAEEQARLIIQQAIDAATQPQKG
jgi:hypothetical protein